MIGRNVPLSYHTDHIVVRRCHPRAVLPSQDDGDVGFDVTCVETVSIPPGKTTRVPTGLQLAETMEPMVVDNRIVSRPFVKVEGRSGMAAKGVFPVGGIIDPGYRGEIEVVLFNSTDKEVTYEAGARVAQFVVYHALAKTVPYHRVAFIETNEVQASDRGSKGLGSSGV
jgi:dUTP pyrophosphatase